MITGLEILSFFKFLPLIYAHLLAMNTFTLFLFVETEPLYARFGVYFHTFTRYWDKMTGSNNIEVLSSWKLMSKSKITADIELRTDMCTSHQSQNFSPETIQEV